MVSFLFRCLCCTKVSVRLRGLPLTVSQNDEFLWGGVFSTSPKPSAGGSPCRLSAAAYSIYSQLTSILRPLFHPQPEDAPCRGDRDPLITECTKHTHTHTHTNIYIYKQYFISHKYSYIFQCIRIIFQGILYFYVASYFIVLINFVSFIAKLQYNTYWRWCRFITLYNIYIYIYMCVCVCVVHLLVWIINHVAVFHPLHSHITKHHVNYTNQRHTRLLYFSFMFRFFLHHHQGELLRPLLQTMCYRSCWTMLLRWF